VTDPYGRILGFLDRSRCFFFIQYLLSFTHEAEWTPLQTHYFLEKLIAAGIGPGTSGPVARNVGTAVPAATQNLFSLKLGGVGS
jgi:hypothetical protein